MAAGWSGAEEGQGAVGPVICSASVPTIEMACGVDPGRSVLEGSNILSNWAMDIGSALGGGSGNTAWKVEDILGAIASGRGQLLHRPAQACQSGRDACASCRPGLW
jgi:hypothetical protein